MARRQVSVRLTPEGGRRTKQELRDVGEAGERGFRKLGREVAAANERMARFARQARLVARVAATVLGAGLAVVVRRTLAAIDGQAKLAQSLNTTTASLQVVTRAGELAGVSFGEIQQSLIQLERRLSLAARQGGPAADALARLGLSADELQRVPVDERLALIQDRLEALVPAGERAAISAQLFGDRAGVVFSRIDSASLERANRELREFGVLLSEDQAAQIQRTNDALSRLRLLFTGLANRLTAAVAPALEFLADGFAAITNVSSPLGQALQGLIDNLGRVAAVVAALATAMAVRWVAGFAAAVVSVKGLATALALLRVALLRLPFVAILALMSEGIFRFSELVTATGSWSEALRLLSDVASEVWARISRGGASLQSSLTSVWLNIRAAWVGTLGQMQADYAAFLRTVNEGFEAVGFGPVVDAFSAETGAVELRRSADALAERGRQFGVLAGLQRQGLGDPLRSLEAIREALANPPTPAPFTPPAAATALPETAAGGGGAGGPAIGQVQARLVTPDMIAQINTGVRKTGEEAAAAADSFERMGQVITGPLQDFVRQGEFNLRSLADTGARILSGFADKLITSAFKPLEDALGSLFKGLSDSGGGGLGGVFSSLLGGVGSLFGFAKGAAFQAGQVVPFATGTVISQPTLFPMAGGRTGLMGERGPEAIMPLRRGRGGSLGVEASAAQPQVTVQNNVMLDPGELLERGLSTRRGERAVQRVVSRIQGGVARA